MFESASDTHSQYNIIVIQWCIWASRNSFFSVHNAMASTCVGYCYNNELKLKNKVAIYPSAVIWEVVNIGMGIVNDVIYIPVVSLLTTYCQVGMEVFHVFFERFYVR